MSFSQNITSPLPDANVLFDPVKAIESGQQIQQNQLGLQSTQLQNNMAQLEPVSRLAATLVNIQDPVARQQQYAQGLGVLQSQGVAMHAPPSVPDLPTLNFLARAGTPSKELAVQATNIQANQAYTGATGGGGGGAGGQPGVAIPAYGTGGPGASATVPAEYMPYFQEASQKTGIPVDLLIAQARQESGFSQNRPGAAGEIGIFQIKPDTARSPGPGMAGVDPATISGPNNARNNIMFGAQYLKSKMGSGDPTNPQVQAQALHAYNGLGAGGDPKYVENVFRYRPAPTAPNTATASAAPPAAPPGAATAPPAPNQFAGPGAPPAPAAPAQAPATGDQFDVPPAAAPAPPQPPRNALAPPLPPAATGQPPAAGAPAAAPAATATPGGPPQPPQAPAPVPMPPPPQPPQVEANGLQPAENARLDALGRSGQLTVQQRATLEQQLRDKNIQQRQQSFSDYMSQQTLAIQQNNSATQKYEADLKAWQAAHPELAPNARVNTLAYRTLQELAPIVRAGNAPQDVIDRYNNAATEYQEYKEVTNPVTKEQQLIPTRPLPDTFPQPSASPVRTLTPGLSPAQQQVERDPAAYEVAKTNYEGDVPEIRTLSASGRQAQADQIRIQQMQQVLQGFSSGPLTDARNAASAFFQRWLPSGLTGWEKDSPTLSGAAAAEEFQKLALTGAGQQDQALLGKNAGYQALETFKKANPNTDLLNPTNASILNMQLITNQANQDYIQAAQAHFRQNEQTFKTTHQYDSLNDFDTNWGAQRNPQVYAAAMGAAGGQDYAQWSKLLQPDEIQRALDVVHRAAPGVTVNGPNGPLDMSKVAPVGQQPAAPAQTPPTTQAPTRVIQYGADGKRLK